MDKTDDIAIYNGEVPKKVPIKYIVILATNHICQGVKPNKAKGIVLPLR